MNTLKLQDSDPIKPDDGLKVGARVAKNRCVYDNPYKKCEYYVLYGVGVDKLTEVIDKAPEAGILRKSGAWYYYEQEDGELIKADKAMIRAKGEDTPHEETDVELKFNGKTSLRDFLNDNPWFADQLKAELRGKAIRGEFKAQAQSEDEMKEIEELNAIEREIAAQEEAAAKKAKDKKPAPKEESEKPKIKTNKKPKRQKEEAK